MFHCRWALRCSLCCYLCVEWREPKWNKTTLFHESIIGRIFRRLDWSNELWFPPGRHRYSRRRRWRYCFHCHGRFVEFLKLLYCIVCVAYCYDEKLKVWAERGEKFVHHIVDIEWDTMRHNGEKWNAMIIRNIPIINNLLVGCCCILFSAEFSPSWYEWHEWMHCNSFHFWPRQPQKSHHAHILISFIREAYVIIPSEKLYDCLYSHDMSYYASFPEYPPHHNTTWSNTT